MGPICLGLPDITNLKLLTWNFPNPMKQQNILQREIDAANGVVLQANTPQSDKIKELVDEEIEWVPIKDNTLSTVDPRDEARVKFFLQRMQPLIDENVSLSGFVKTEPIELDLINRKPIWINQYNIPHIQQMAVDEQVAKWLAKGRLRKSKSPWNLPLTTAVKKDEMGT